MVTYPIRNFLEASSISGQIISAHDKIKSHLINPTRCKSLTPRDVISMRWVFVLYFLFSFSLASCIKKNVAPAVVSQKAETLPTFCCWCKLKAGENTVFSVLSERDCTKKQSADTLQNCQYIQIKEHQCSLRSVRLGASKKCIKTPLHYLKDGKEGVIRPPVDSGPCGLYDSAEEYVSDSNSNETQIEARTPAEAEVDENGMRKKDSADNYCACVPDPGAIKNCQYIHIEDGKTSVIGSLPKTDPMEACSLQLCDAIFDGPRWDSIVDKHCPNYRFQTKDK